MLNTDVFKFEFVDRNDERNIIDSFLNDWSDQINYSLWINGKRGAGKSFLLTEYVVINKTFTSVYVNVDINSASPGSYLKIFISQLSRAAKLTFINYLKANYKAIADIGKKAANILLNLADIDDIGFDKLTTTITNYYVTKHGEKENATSVVKKYISESLNKCSNIVFILDNFSQCDVSSLEVIVQIIHEFQDCTQLKFIVCTTEDDLNDRTDIKMALSERISNHLLYIAPFNQKQLFVRMLEKNFNLNEEDIKLLAKTFELCEGYPQGLREVLINLYTARGIHIYENKAHFAVNVFRQMLIKKAISFDIESLCKERKGAKIILQTIAIWGAPIIGSVLFDFFDYLAGIEFIPIIKEEITQTIHILESVSVLSKTYDEHMLMIQFEHDSLKVAVNEYFRNDRSIPFLHFSIYEYLMSYQNKQDHPYWHRHYISLCAYHSFASKAEGWIESNYHYGYSFYTAELFSEAENIFSRLEPIVASLKGAQLLTLGITFFRCGQYNKAKDILSIIQSRTLMSEFSVEQRIMTYIYLARINSCLLNSAEALNKIAKAEEMSANAPALHIATLGAKQSILFLTPGKFVDAKRLFDDLISESAETQEMASIYQSSMDYYEGDKSLTLLKRGLELSKEFSNSITEGKILNNLGFESLRCGEYKEAQRFFIDSVSTIKKQQPHQQTYPYSNLAVLNMIIGKWQDALDNILEAIFWNKSDYASLVLKSNRMLCYYYINNHLWEDVWNELRDYILSSPVVDDKIYKKCASI